jgi:hypothetical protein
MSCLWTARVQRGGGDVSGLPGFLTGLQHDHYRVSLYAQDVSGQQHCNVGGESYAVVSGRICNLSLYMFHLSELHADIV